MRRIFWLIAVASFFITTQAIAAVEISGVQATMTWIEPTQNKNGTPLLDLARTEGTFQIPGQAETMCGTAPASIPSGGQEQSVQCVVPVPQDTEFDVTFRAYAYDTSNNKSDASSLIKRIDLLAPGAPIL